MAKRVAGNEAPGGSLREDPARGGEWLTTYPTRTRFYPLDPRPSEVHIEDIAQALSNICRYNGHVPQHYSVAQHSVLVAFLCLLESGPEAARAGLLHDAAEAYVGDATWPYKQSPHMEEHLVVERRISAAVHRRFGIDWSRHREQVKRADTRVLLAEFRDLLGEDPGPVRERVGAGPSLRPWPVGPIKACSPDWARLLFLDKWHKVGGS